MATSQRLLAFAIFGLLVAGFVSVAVKDSGEDPLVIAPTESPSPTPTETFTFPGPIPTESDTGLFPTESESPAGPDVSPTDTMSELPRTGRGSLALPALLTLVLAALGSLMVRRSARSVS
ncbi:MAG TPA: hypothetical protein VJ922_01515 [Actinomycetota bacterium]|nr:hypothetical protein [Actinomycetota bacterium]